MEASVSWVYFRLLVTSSDSQTKLPSRQVGITYSIPYTFSKREVLRATLSKTIHRNTKYIIIANQNRLYKTKIS